MIFLMRELQIIFSSLKMQSYVEVKNYRRKDIAELENTSVWLTNVHVRHYFNEYIRSEKKRDILKIKIYI